MPVSRLRLRLALAAVLAALTLGLYAPVFTFEFVNYDDNVYVADNAHVASGWSPANAVWSLTAFENGNWHPLTLMSHMLDVQLFGQNAHAHHGVNLVLHVVNVLLLFALFAGATGRPWPAALVAALFAVHPVNVQTVAWVAERKSLLSTAFWLAALLAHVRYRKQGSARAYVLVVVFAGLALAAKPMAVTLPLTLVLLDLWPLTMRPDGRRSLAARYARELAPTVALAFGCGLLTIAAQKAGHALQTVSAYTWPARLGNAVVSYAWYLGTMVWPGRLAVFYPHPMDTLAAAKVAGCAIALAAITAVVTWKGKAFPPLAMGWWWYVGTVLPVAGVIQVGSQAYADRYAYVPLIGIFVIVAWLAAHAAHGAPAWRRRLIAVLCVVWIAALSLTTRAQLPYWRDSVALFSHAIDVVPDNALAHNNLGMALVEEGKIGEALGHFHAAAKIAPWDADARANEGNALRALGRPAEAAEAYTEALGQAPDDASLHYNLATALVDLSRFDEAVTHLGTAVTLDPAHAKARMLLGTLLYRQGRAAEALAQFAEIARLDPGDQRAREWVRRLEGSGGAK
jgi:predicted negative regulator of RcsB-dependent stress response